MILEDVELLERVANRQLARAAQWRESTAKLASLQEDLKLMTNCATMVVKPKATITYTSTLSNGEKVRHQCEVDPSLALSYFSKVKQDQIDAAQKELDAI